MTDIIAADELRAIIDSAERLAAEKRDIADAEKEVFAEAKGRGYDTKVLRKIIRDRKLARDALAEFEAVEEMYRNAIGMA